MEKLPQASSSSSPQQANVIVPTTSPTIDTTPIPSPTRANISMLTTPINPAYVGGNTDTPTVVKSSTPAVLASQSLLEPNSPPKPKQKHEVPEDEIEEVYTPGTAPTTLPQSTP